eukprot:Opistho-2@65647
MWNDKIRIVSSILMLVGWILLFAFFAKIFYDADHPTNNNKDNLSVFYYTDEPSGVWFVWPIMAILLTASITSALNMPILASRFAMATVVLMFDVFDLTAPYLTSCRESDIDGLMNPPTGRRFKSSCRYNSLGMAGAVIVLVAAIICVLFVGTEFDHHLPNNQVTSINNNNSDSRQDASAN